jgi:23S rRNA (uracil1939-C5)-methyltransferase
LRAFFQKSAASLISPEELRIEYIGTEGDGVGHLANGATVYLPNTLPGELVLAQSTIKRGDGWAATAELLSTSPERAAPPCQHFATCGGCALQHWDDAAYLAWKTGLLATALARAGYSDAPAPTIRTPPYARRRIDLAVQRKGATLVLGLHARRSAEIVDLQACPVLHPALFTLIAPLRILLRSLNGLRRSGSAILNLLESGPDLLLRLDAPLSTPDRTKLAAFAAAHFLPRITAAVGDGPHETAAQQRPPITSFSGVTVTPPPGAFLQASAEGESAIIAAIVAGLPPLKGRARIAELYAGCGTLTFALARHARVAAYEGDAEAHAALRHAANTQGLAGRVEAHRRDLTRQPLSPKELAAFAAVVLDPPHNGAVAQAALIAASGVARIIYVSCNPATLGRDAKLFRDAGYKLLAATPIDQFLWSPCLESVTVFGK